MNIIEDNTEVFIKNAPNSHINTLTEAHAFGNVFIATICSTQPATDKIASNVAVAAAIAAKARIRLHQGLLDVEQAGGRVLYTDTDSIFAAFKKKMVNVAHGEVFWDSDKAFVFDNAVFATSKGYALKTASHEVVKLRGFNSTSLTFTEFQNHFKDSLPLKCTQMQLLKKNQKIKYLEIEKRILLNLYDKRTFNKEKTHTLPRSFFQNTPTSCKLP